MVVATQLVGECRVEHQPQCRSGIRVELSARHAHLHRSEVFVFGEVVLAPCRHVGSSGGVPCQAVGEVDIQVSLCIEAVVVVVEDVEGVFHACEVRSRPHQDGGCGIVAVGIEHLSHRHSAEGYGVVVYRRVGCRVGLSRRTVYRPTEGDVLAYLMVEVSAQREALCPCIHICSFLVHIAKREEELSAVGSLRDREVIFLFDAGREHHVHPVGVGQFADGSGTEHVECRACAPCVTRANPVFGVEQSDVRGYVTPAHACIQRHLCLLRASFLCGYQYHAAGSL